MIDKQFWDLVIVKWSEKKRVASEEPIIKPIEIPDDGDEPFLDIGDIMDELSGLGDLID